MKKSIWLVLCMSLTAFAVSGCSKGVASAEYHTQDVCPNVLVTGDSDTSTGYFYLVDRNTGVVYLCYDGYNRMGITVMLNVDGTPITAEQLGIEY